MLTSLVLKDVGPRGELVMGSLAPRFNVITGDNGLGKSFLLETAWWALTRTWHEVPAVPSAPDAEISYSFGEGRKPHTFSAKWDTSAQQWKRKVGRPPNPGLVLYARIDGSFSVWDPARNYRLYRRQDGGEAESPASYQFSSLAVFEGLRRRVREGGAEREQVLCAGLIDDWTRWQDSGDARFDLLRRLLGGLGPGGSALVPGQPQRPTLDDQRRIPTVVMFDGQEVPLTYAPAGVKRAAKLAYLLAWAFSEHEQEAERIGQPMSPQVIVLLDEPETHLHPRWQRTILPSLWRAVEGWHGTHKPQAQFLVATHSPLVLASMEPLFDPKQDTLWKLDLVEGRVRVERDHWRLRGDVNRWLLSDVFDLSEATSSEAEEALGRAKELLRQDKPERAEVLGVSEELGRLLPEMDPFWVRWRYYMRSHLEEGGEA